MSSTTSDTTTREFDGLTIPQAGTFELDPSHSSVNFVVRHLMVSKVRGNFGQFSGTITVGDDPLSSSAQVQVQAASVFTGDDQRDGHLKSADFFDVESFPTVDFVATGLSPKGDDGFVLDGELTVRGVTKPVQLQVEYAGVTTDPWGNQRIGFSASTEVNREEFGLTWNQALETGGVLVGNKAKLEIEAEAIRQS